MWTFLWKQRKSLGSTLEEGEVNALIRHAAENWLDKRGEIVPLLEKVKSDCMQNGGDMKSMYNCLPLLLIALVITGCFSTRKIYDPESKVMVIDYSAIRRGAYILTGNDNNTKIVSEPAPDIAKDITASLGLSAQTIEDIASPELKVKYASKVIDLANRSQTLQVLREALFRSSEMGASSDLSKDQRVALYNMARRGNMKGLSDVRNLLERHGGDAYEMIKGVGQAAYI